MRFPLCCGSYLQKRSNPVKRTHFLICLWGHFSYLDDSSRSDVTRGSRWTNGLFCDAPGAPVCAAWGTLRGCGWNSQLEFTLRPVSSCAATDQQQRRGEASVPWFHQKKEGRVHQWLCSALGHIFCLPNPVRNIGRLVDPTQSASIV